MCQPIDYSVFDRRDILQMAFYPRKEYRQGPPNARDLAVPTENDVVVSCRLYVHERASPCILFFHGNGEVVSDYDDIAPMFNSAGVNLLVADYRGYGSSGGKPSFASMIADAHAIFRSAENTLKQEGYTGGVYVMGRSLGSLSALELACQHQAELKGLIIESGFASPTRLLRRIGGAVGWPGFEEADAAARTNLEAIGLRTLIIHGEYDDLIPLEEGRHVFETIGAADKRLVVIPDAGHNDVMFLGAQRYFGALSDFVAHR